ncbi:hypothetical protein D9613_001054 [Agrocybe pediades]|uniref:Uncharacterized protein n=1 Tax=Agrocybe pediades TaxID=84607 RepID=A0A8H4R1T7_9AGAR|nr:hypothetical protein D9613_001054 [Agrocybe pediades]
MVSYQYLPHVIFGMALTSMSMNLVSQRRKTEEERYRVEAHLSILESIKKELQSNEPLSEERLGKLRRLAEVSRPMTSNSTLASEGQAVAEKPKDDKFESNLRESVGWSQVFKGQKPPQDSEDTLSKWDKHDLDIIKKELSKSE